MIITGGFTVGNLCTHGFGGQYSEIPERICVSFVLSQLHVNIAAADIKSPSVTFAMRHSEVSQTLNRPRGEVEVGSLHVVITMNSPEC